MNLHSVILFCVSAAAVFGNTIKPDTTDVGADEGQKVKLSCSYSSPGGTDYLFWYRQYGRSKPEFLVSTFSTKKDTEVSEVDSRLSVKVTKKEQIHMDLEISSAALSDSALFYCALRPTSVKIVFGGGTKLTVQSKEKKKADVYKLQDSCLATDFTNHEDVKFEASVISATPVRYSGEKYQNYYSSFAWNAGNNCTESGGCKDGSSGSSDMEIDEKINFVSLGLFWLRILLLKTVVFNILMTFKAWMS